MPHPYIAAQATRGKNLRDLIKRHDVDLDAPYSGAEDLAPFIDGSEGIERYAVVTMGGEDSTTGMPRPYIYPWYEDIDSAVAKAVENIGDRIYEEVPVEIVNLDTNERMTPKWNELAWTRFPSTPVQTEYTLHVNVMDEYGIAKENWRTVSVTSEEHPEGVAVADVGQYLVDRLAEAQAEFGESVAFDLTFVCI